MRIDHKKEKKLGIRRIRKGGMKYEHAWLTKFKLHSITFCLLFFFNHRTQYIALSDRTWGWNLMVKLVFANGRKLDNKKDEN